MNKRTSNVLRVAVAALLVPSWVLHAGISHLAAASQEQGGGSPGGAAVIPVSTEAELQAAVARLSSGTTIVIAPGTYRLTATLTIATPVSDIVIKGASANAADVVLVGRGMSNPSHEGVRHGIEVRGRVRGITIANLTIQDVFEHAVLIGGETAAPRIHNVRLINAGGTFIKAAGDARGVDDGVVEYSVMEYTAASRDAGTGAVEVAAGAGWEIRYNLFRNIEAPAGQSSGPAVLAWKGSRDTIVEGNVFFNCQQEIALGLEDSPRQDHSGGIIRNNAIYRESIVRGGAAILVADSPRTEVLHNTILANNTSSSSVIEYRFAGTTDVVIKNNLLDGPVSAVKGATGTAGPNYTQAQASMFVNAAAGDLHLAPTATAVIDMASPVSEAAADFEGHNRPQGVAADYGADEYVGPAAPAPIETAAANPPMPAPAGPGSSRASQPAAFASAPESLTTSASLTVDPQWDSIDIGRARTGSTAISSGTFTVMGGGPDITGSADSFRFVYQVLEGDGEIVARVIDLQKTTTRAKAGVMIRNSLARDAKYAAAFVTAGEGLLFQRRIAAGATTTRSSGGSGRAPKWLKLVRSGNTFTAFKSADGTTWKPMGSEVVYLGSKVYFGLAVSSGSYRLLAKARFEKVVAAGSPTNSNQPPSVALVEPAANTSCTMPCSIAMKASASDSDGSISQVAFYAGSTLIGKVSGSPYSVTWSSVPAGNYTLTAVARDNEGLQTTSAPIKVSVLSSTVNQPPTIALTSPASGATFTAPASVTLAATATDQDGTITKVEFFAGSTRIGSDTSSPFSYAWIDAPAGTYTLSAKAWDNSGASMISGGVNVSISAASPVPAAVAITSPTGGATFLAPANVTVSASASDPDGIARVDFYAGSQLIGTDSVSPYSITWSNVADGYYTLKAVARDTTGASTASATVTITVAVANAKLLTFTASADHSTNVTSYVVEFYKAGTTPGSVSPVRTQDAGKPTPVNGDITVDIQTSVQLLSTGSYFTTVRAIGPGGSTRSAPSSTFMR